MKQAGRRGADLSEDALNRAIATYAAGELRPGLETRVLNAVIANRDEAAAGWSSRWVWKWCFAGTGAVLAFALTLVLWTHSASWRRPPLNDMRSSQNNFARDRDRGVREFPAAPTIRAAAGPSRKASLPVLKASASKGLHAAERGKLNGQERLNGQEQLTSQERLLARLVANGAADELTLPPAHTHPIDRVESTPIEIRPLVTEPIFIAPIRIAALQPLPTPDH